MQNVIIAWSTSVTGSPSFVWEKKIKDTKIALKYWVKNPTYTPTRHKKETVQLLENLQIDLESKEITYTELEKEQATQDNSFLSFRQEEEFWRLKSRSLWLKEGDRNTSFFHRKCRARLSINHISEITSSDDTLFKGQDQIKLAVETHFQNLYKDNREGIEEFTSEFLSHIPLLLTREDNITLTKPFTEE